MNSTRGGNLSILIPEEIYISLLRYQLVSPAGGGAIPFFAMLLAREILISRGMPIAKWANVIR